MTVAGTATHLRNPLSCPAEVVREVGLLVYDEVHYLRDTERGVVWEESIILAPKATRMAFLSATLPNSAEFAGWVAATHGSPVHVVYTEYRPTPLQHYMFPAGACTADAFGCVGS
jgi:ATP-dependent RNA helicase DOB1